MATLLDNYWAVIRQRIKDRVAANSSAQVMSVINSMIQDNTIEWKNGWQISVEENLAIVRPLLENGEYEMLRDGVDIYISRNPNYRLNQNIIETNESLQSANTSTAELNTETKKYYKKANFSTRAIIWVSSIGAFMALISATVATIALINNHKQFVIETTPFLQVEPLAPDITPGQFLTINYLVKNLGKDQAKIDSCQIGIIVDRSIDTLIFLHRPSSMASTIPNAYSIKENPYQGSANSHNVLINDIINIYLRRNEDWIYFYGIIHYTNLADGKKREYYFNIQIFQHPPNGIQYLWNENRDQPY